MLIKMEQREAGTGKKKLRDMPIQTLLEGVACPGSIYVRLSRLTTVVFTGGQIYPVSDDFDGEMRECPAGLTVTLTNE